MPSVRIGSSSTIFFLSISKSSCFFASCAISFEDTEPKVLPPSPDLIFTTTVLSSSTFANSFAASNFSFAILSSFAFFNFRSFRFFGVASSPSFFGSTKSVEKLRKLSLFRAEKWCIIKIVLFQVSEKTGNFLKNIRDSAFLYCQNLADLL